MKPVLRLFRPLLPALLPALLACALALSGAASAGNAAGLPAGEAHPLVVNPEAEPLSREALNTMVEEATEAFYTNDALMDELLDELTFTREEMTPEGEEPVEKSVITLTHGGKSMRCILNYNGEVIQGSRSDPLYLMLHGGGEGTEAENTGQWLIMSDYYTASGSPGLYVACRGISDTWDLHFQEDTYPLLDRLIEAMILLYDADPNRVYLLGFSAGGDGVYQLTPRLADRFAAVNMSSGHPNGVSLLNLANCPISLQAGVRDFLSESAMRSVRAAEYEKILSDYHEKYGFGYQHRVFIHVPNGHFCTDYEDCTTTVLKDPTAFAACARQPGFLDRFLDILEESGEDRDVFILSYLGVEDSPQFDQACTDLITKGLSLETEKANTNAVAYVSQFSRDPAPANLVWDLSTRAPKREKNSFYWLEAAPDVNRGVVTASYHAETNTITVEPDADVNGDFAILFHPALVDLTRPVTVKTGNITRTVQVNPSREFLEASIRETGDPKLACVGKILYSQIIQSEN